MEQLLATSVDDKIRSECRDILIRLYGQIVEKENVYRLTEYCPGCKAANLFAAFNGKYEKEARENSQKLLQGALFRLRTHLPRQTEDYVLKAKAIEKLIDLYCFVFYDGNFEFVHSEMMSLYIDLAHNMIQQGRVDDVFSALENALGYEVYQLNVVGGVEYELKASGTVIKVLESGTLEVDAFVYPERITEKTNGSYEFELSPDVLEVAVYGVAADLLKSDVSAEYGSVYATRFETMLQRLDPRYSMGSFYIDGGISL